MTKRFLFSVLALLVLVAFGWAAGPKKVIVHYHWTETIYDPINLNAVKIFEKKHPDVEVKLVLVPDGDRATIIRTVLAANGQIDAMSLTNGDSAEFLSAGQAVPIDPKGFGKSSVDDVVKMWTPGSIESCGGYWDGQYYGIPYEQSNYVAWVNTAFMKQAGLAKKDLPKTWADFVTFAKKLVKVDNGVTVRNGFMCNSKQGIFNFLVISAMMEQLGLDWGSEKGFIDSMDQTDTLVRGLKTYTDFVTTDKIWDPALDDNDREGFGNGKSGIFLTGGTWYWGVLDTYSVKRKDVAAIPVSPFRGWKGYRRHGLWQLPVRHAPCKGAGADVRVARYHDEPDERVHQAGPASASLEADQWQAGPRQRACPEVHPVLRPGVQGRAGTPGRVVVFHEDQPGCGRRLGRHIPCHFPEHECGRFRLTAAKRCEELVPAVGLSFRVPGTLPGTLRFFQGARGGACQKPVTR